MAEGSSELNETKNDLEIIDQADDSALNEEKDLTENEISDDPDEIRGQIEETRRDMSETLDAIQEKLSFSNISEQVKDQVSEQITGAVETLKTTVSDATIGKAGKFMTNIGHEIKKSNVLKLAGENPLPLVLIGLGIGLLAFKNKKSSSAEYENYRYKQNYRDIETDDSEQKQLKDKAAGISRRIGDSASSAYESVSGTADSTYRAVKGTAGDVYGKIGGKVKRQYNTHLNENPLIIGAVALAVGAVVGFAIPLTDYEGELMGEARDNLMSKAGGAARGAIEKAQDVVGQAKDTISEDIKNVVGQAKESLNEAAKTQS